MLGIKRVCVHQTQQQRSRQNEFQRFRRCSGYVMLERNAFHNNQKLDYCANTSVTIGDKIQW